MFHQVYTLFDFPSDVESRLSVKVGVKRSKLRAAGRSRSL